LAGEPGSEFSASNPAPWLEVIDGCSPILLIAPHGGRAGPAARMRPDPKVNDLHTAHITRTLAATLSASALINAAMDRNQLDCNRLGQLVERAPWLLEMIERLAAAIVERHGRVIVLLIHGWNIIEPRVDFGLGARLRDGKLVPAGSAHISASDEFINGPVAAMAERMGRHGITPGFGFRYPGGGFHNLLQAFTPRHLESTHPALRQLAMLAGKRAIEAVQLELSVAVRMPGSLREHALEAIGAVFRPDAAAERSGNAPIPVVRTIRPKAPALAPRAERAGIPTRLGIEFYDPAAGIGAMASFDLGPAAMGARIMMMLERPRVALFTSEGVAQSVGGRIALGPLALQADGPEVTLKFRGPMVLVPDGTAYLSIERALASGALDETAEVAVRLRLPTPLNLAELLASGTASTDSVAAFGRLDGTITIGGEQRQLDGIGRLGLSFTGIGSARFVSRRMIWACFASGDSHTALEARVIANDDGSTYSAARYFSEPGWTACDLTGLELDAPSAETPPERIAARIAIDGAAHTPLLGEVRCFVPLSRPGPNQSRIYTAMGFASFQLGGREGVGMFEYSRRSTPASIGRNDQGDDGDDATG
jgi:hypothetical protein